jgi:membrane-associated phospholipid phosphatase
MLAADYVTNIVLSIILIVGAYQFYFFTQRHPVKNARSFTFSFDEKIPYSPNWVWIYSFLYYPAILYLNLIVDSPRHFNYVALNFIFLLFLQMAFFLIFPVETPQHWRGKVGSGQSLSDRFLAFVQRFDAPSNCFPSMHTSVAMLTALHAYATIGPVAWLFPILIGVSCLFTKQHYMIDLPAGALLGWLAYQVFALVY